MASHFLSVDVGGSGEISEVKAVPHEIPFRYPVPSSLPPFRKETLEKRESGECSDERLEVCEEGAIEGRALQCASRLGVRTVFPQRTQGRADD